MGVITALETTYDQNDWSDKIQFSRSRGEDGVCTTMESTRVDPKGTFSFCAFIMNNKVYLCCVLYLYHSLALAMFTSSFFFFVLSQCLSLCLSLSLCVCLSVCLCLSVSVSLSLLLFLSDSVFASTSYFCF